MAHSSYHCCAVCDSKMQYAEPEALTKEKICDSCIRKLRDNYNLLILDATELIAWMDQEKPKVVVAILEEVGYESCSFDNRVDDKLKEVLDKFHKEQTRVKKYYNPTVAGDDPKKVFWNIGELGKDFNVATSAIRFWEGEFPDELTPFINEKGIRRYKIKDYIKVKKFATLVVEYGFRVKEATMWFPLYDELSKLWAKLKK